jgi:threonine/homoserine/homoserine lactone efflux protein
MGLIKVFFWGLVISFLGTLPLSTLNVAAMQISVQEGVQKAMNFSLGTIFTEMIYVGVALVGINWVRKQKKLFRWLEWITFIIVAALAIGSFIAATKQYESKNIILNNHMNRFVLGLILSAVTPMHIPFWFGWSTVLFTKKILQPIRYYYYLYIVGSGIGTFMANCIFIFGGKYIVEKLNANQNTLNWIIGGIFAVTAMIQLIKILLHKDVAEKLDTLT